MIDFFFDTADVDYISNAWAMLAGPVDKAHVRGITTNPNAFNKINLQHLDEWETHLPLLCETVSQIRGDDKGVVYVQAPNSNMPPGDVLKWAKHISKFTDGNTKLGLKIPPYKPILEIVEELNSIMETNVTGIADCATALLCFTYGIKYVSVIPGRMEEKGLDAKAHIAYINQRKDSNAEIITGSMRTLEGLKWVSQYGTVPTIGTGVWDLVFNEMGVEGFCAIKREAPKEWARYAPTVTDVSTQLSKDFFGQMDYCGTPCLTDFITDHLSN